MPDLTDITDEQLITLSQAAKLMPSRRRGKPVHTTTVWRWYRYGVCRGGERVFLEAVELPSGVATSKEALTRFIRRLTDLSHGDRTDSVKVTNPNVKQQLDEKGLSESSTLSHDVPPAGEVNVQ